MLRTLNSSLSHRKCNGESFWGRASSSGEKQPGRLFTGKIAREGGCRARWWFGGERERGMVVEVEGGKASGRADPAAAYDLRSRPVAQRNASVTFDHKFKSSGNSILETSGSFRIQIPARRLILETSGSFRIQIPARRLILETSGSFRIQIPARSGNSRKFQNPVSSSWSVSGNKA
jgi:hypothetical protein